MKDQVENLRKKNITAFAIFSGMSRKEVINTFKTASESNCKFLYVSPERLETSLFKEYLPGLGVNLIAVDEAHCISQWGYDFRPPYLRIAALRDELPDVPVLALTASATSSVQKDICEKLRFDEPTILRQSFERPNLSYSVFRVDSKINKLIDILKKVSGSAIIYCKSRKRTKEISGLLQLQGISADHYHAGLEQEERSRKQEEWINNKIRVIVCTNAFGMGIDKPDVRCVVHADIPNSLEHYYQEAGRAGRDGKTSFAVLLHDDHDLAELNSLTDLQFPSLTDIRTVYQAIANYLQIPTGSGQGEYFEFDITDFVKKFKLNGQTTLYALKALEQEGWLSFNEQVFLSARIAFTTSKDLLYDFEKNNVTLEPLIKTLLRSYEGIFDQSVPVSEKMIAGWLRKEPDEIKIQLESLNRAGIIQYEPQKDKPQLFFLRDRIRSEDINIDMTAYEKRKQDAMARIKQIINYAQEKTACRSRLIGTYFGDTAMKDCGICDNCLKRRSSPISKEEFDSLYHRIINILKYESLPARDLISKLNGVKKEKAMQVLDFLQAENKIEMDKTGYVKFKSH